MDLMGVTMSIPVMHIDMLFQGQDGQRYNSNLPVRSLHYCRSAAVPPETTNVLMSSILGLNVNRR